MTAVAFHFNVPDRRAYTCRLLRKAYRAGARVVVTGDSALLSEIDRLLWTFDALEFVPHWRGRSVAEVPARMRDTPVLLAVQHGPELGHGVLVNLGHEPPVGHDRYARVIEIVSREEIDREQARVRWRHYQSQGCTIERHEVQA